MKKLGLAFLFLLPLVSAADASLEQQILTHPTAPLGVAVVILLLFGLLLERVLKP